MKLTESKGLLSFELASEALAKRLHSALAARGKEIQPSEEAMIDFEAMKITPRDGQVLKLLVQGCSNKEIAEQLRISPRTVKQHLRTLFLRAGITQGRKRVKLATAIYQKEQQQCIRAIG